MFNLQNLLPGEHIVSGFLRSYTLSGYREFGEVLMEVGASKLHKLAANDPFNLAQLNIMKMYQSQFGHSITYLLNEHTLYPLYKVGNPFRSIEQVVDCMLESNNGSAPLWVQRKDKAYQCDWRLCGQCAHDDQKLHGVSYWHCDHQVPTVGLCHKHNEKLVSVEHLYKISRTKVIPLFPHTVKEGIAAEVKPISTEWDGWLAQLFMSLKKHNQFNLLKAKAIITTHFDLERIALLPEDIKQIHQTFDKTQPLPQLHHYKTKPLFSKDSEKYLRILEKYFGYQFLSQVFKFYGEKGRVNIRSNKNIIVGAVQNIKQQIEDPIVYLLLLNVMGLSPVHLEIDYGQFSSDTAA